MYMSTRFIQLLQYFTCKVAGSDICLRKSGFANMLLIWGFCKAAPNWGFIAAIYRNEMEMKVSERERERE